ncbi:MAG: N-formylglutamate amidohydrolase [Rhodopseudomonas palustris]|nr:N-formylglutamate amidohydrolase [Rhodopseudomonas palustris]
MDLEALRRSEDSVHGRTDPPALVDRGFPVMQAHFPRCYIDVNREPYELDPRMFDRPAAELRQHPLDAGRGRARHHARVVAATARRSIASASPSMTRCGRIESAVQAVSPRAAQARSTQTFEAFGTVDRWSIAIRCRSVGLSRDEPRRAPMW